MALWPPALGSKWKTAKDDLQREVLWHDERRVRVRSSWALKNGGMTSHTMTVSRMSWERWEAQQIDQT